MQSSDGPPSSGKPLDRLETWFIGEGYISQGVPMSRDDIQVRMIQASRESLRRGIVTSADIDEILALLPGQG